MWSTHLGIVCPKSSPASTPEVLILNSIQRRTSNPSLPSPPMFMPAFVHKALRSFNPVDITSLSDFGVIGIGVTNAHFDDGVPFDEAIE